MELEGLDLNNILGSDEFSLFNDDSTTEESPTLQDSEENKKDEEIKVEKDETTEVNAEELFDSSESVGSEETKLEREDTQPKGSGTSPKSFFSSIAKAFKEEGIFPDLSDEDAVKITSPEDFRNLMEQLIRASLDEKLKRIDEALNYGVEPSEISQYENTIEYLNNIKDSDIQDESDGGEKLRKNLIYQDYINRGYSKERAQREVLKSFNAGTDIEDAKESLKSNSEFFKQKYQLLIDDAKNEEEAQILARKEQAENLRKSILEDKSIFGDIEIDKSTRQRIFDNITKPVYKDPETGQYLTALQKAESENKVDFIKNLGIVFTLTNGFKDIDSLVKGKVKREVKKGLRELENVINSTQRTSDGNLKFVTGVNDDPESFIGKGWNIDV